MNYLLCGIGKSEILEKEIHISEYPFEPAVVYPKKIIRSNEIRCIKCGFWTLQNIF